MSAPKKPPGWPSTITRPPGPVVQALDTPCECKGLPGLYRRKEGWGTACSSCGYGSAQIEPQKTKTKAALAWLKLRGVEPEGEP